MLSLATDTHAKLKAEESNPLIAEILLFFEVVFFAYRDIGQQYEFRTGDYRGATLGFENIMDTVPQVIRTWESGVRAVYIEDTPEEKAIFPGKRGPFQTGTYENRLNAIGALATKTTGIPALAGVGAQVTSFYNTALAARLAQQMDEGSVGEISDLRENQRILLSKEMMGVLGKLMFIHRFNLVEVERYFDLSLLRKTGEEEDLENIIKTGNVGANMQLYINLDGAVITPETIFGLLNPINVPGSILKGQFHSTINAPFDVNRNFVEFESLNPAVQATAAELGYDQATGLTKLILYANDQQAALRIEIEQ
jgi:hypothetical protein